MKQEHSVLSPVPGEAGFQGSAQGPGPWRHETAVPQEQHEGGEAGSGWLIGVCVSWGGSASGSGTGSPDSRTE